MKKLSTLIILLLCFNGVYAQLQWGIKGGLNLSKFTEVETDLNPSFHVGLGLQYMFTERMGLETGLYYSGTGAVRKSDMINDITGEKFGTGKYTYRMDNIQLPVMFTVKFKIAEDIYFCPAAGGYFSYATGGKIKNKENYANTTDTYYYNFFGGLPFSDVINAGATVALNFEFNNYYTRSTYDDQTNKIILGLSYDHGLMPVKSTDIYLSEQSDFFIQNFKVSLGFLF